MRIVSFVNNNSGPAYHRCIMPLMLMGDVDVYITNNLLEADFEKGCDILMYNRILPEHCMGMIAKLKAAYGFKICVDIDDYWHLDEHHILYSLYQEDNFAATQLRHISNADIVTTTHARLAQEIRQHHTNVHVLPNAIPHQGQFDIIRKPHHLTRLFWQGSITHGEDIALIKRPIDCLTPIAKKIQMVIGGYVEGNDEWYNMVADYTSGIKHQYKILPGISVDKYYSMYEHADICLVPLLNTKFNRMKSNLKVLEAANLSLPVICSKVDPYLDLPVIYAKGVGDWVNGINRLVASKKRQKDAGAELKEYCDIHYNFKKINKERKQIFEYEAG